MVKNNDYIFTTCFCPRLQKAEKYLTLIRENILTCSLKNILTFEDVYHEMKENCGFITSLHIPFSVYQHHLKKNKL